MVLLHFEPAQHMNMQTNSSPAVHVCVCVCAIPFLWQCAGSDSLSGTAPHSFLVKALGETGDRSGEHLPTLPHWVSAENEFQPCAYG